MMAKIVKGSGARGIVDYILDKKKQATLIDCQGVLFNDNSTIAKNAGVSASEIVRMAIRDSHIRARLTTEQADYIRKLCGMANNLNQLTRKAHREGVRLHYGQCQHLLLSLENIIDHISL